MFCVLYPFDYKIPSGYIGSIAEQDFRWRDKKAKWLGLLLPCGFTFVKKREVSSLQMCSISELNGDMHMI